MKKFIGLFLVGCLLFVSCQTTKTEVESVEETDSVQKTADLIDSIYVQTWTPETESLCKEARLAWDSLTDEQKELVEGEYADPDYFGADTGDASKDYVYNGSVAGEKLILVVSFGTSFNDSRAQDIGGIEAAVAKAFPDWEVRRAFTSQIIINHILARDNVKILNVKQALDAAVSSGVKELVVLPTHLMSGHEYDELSEELDNYKDSIPSIKLAKNLLSTQEDKEFTAKAVFQTANVPSDTALVVMGHGTSHSAKVTYTQMQKIFSDNGYSNVFVGTVEGEPEETEVSEVIDAVHEAGFTKVVLRPLMVVAGDHANNDMAGEDEDSWLSLFNASGYFETVDVQIAGLGRIPEVQSLYVKHLGEIASTTAPADYGYVKFESDSSMFHLNETLKGKAKLVLNRGVLCAEMIMPSKNIVNIAMEPNGEGLLLAPETVTVTYDDGATEEVYAFYLPAKAFNESFVVSILGTKGVWYDHTVTLTK